MEDNDKLVQLKQIIGRYTSAVIAFSGGVDSTFLAAVSAGVLGRKALLVTAHSSTYPKEEEEKAKEIATTLHLENRVIVSEETEIAGFVENPPDRCYYCKKELFAKITHIAKTEGYDVVFDGSNVDDLKDYRPGRKALAEQGIVSPLCEAGLTKQEIRSYSHDMGLPTWNKPAYACLASRFPYGENISVEKLQRVGETERRLREMGFTQFRARSHGDCVRLEFIEPEIERAWRERDQVAAACKQAGFAFVSIDTQGYRTGAMNEVLGRA
jgi:pyridinium-3,5-biscarboxylic acid mononucleotide sulfurtransferase